MVPIAQSNETKETLKWKIIDLYEYLLENQDQDNAFKVEQLARKLATWDFTIAFCGHFSAGKSTMINQVLGEKLLPSSPIPTSANLVKVKAGEDYAKVFFKHGKPRLYLAPYDYNLVKNYCKDGDLINEVEISYSKTSLPPHTIIMDTPGIDSADDAHRIATESAIHLADLVFYVMDYNHVQAEQNFLFVKELTEAGKEVNLVINQIDKHREEEVSFTEFQQATAAAFAAWGVKPSRIFYTSMRENEHPFNEFHEFQQFIFKKIADKDFYLLHSIANSLKKITKDYLTQKEISEEQKIEAARERLDLLPTAKRQEISRSYQAIQDEINRAKTAVDYSKLAFNLEIDKIIKNAYLLPFETRALAEAYLTARQPDFKAGFLFAKQKAENERQLRLDRFYQDILTRAKAQLEWHIREYIVHFLKEAEIDAPDVLAEVQSFSITFSPELLKNVVKPGAGLTGAYVLQYTNDVADEIKAVAKKQLVPLKRALFETFEAIHSRKIKKLEKSFIEVEQFYHAHQALQDKEIQMESERLKIKELLQRKVFREDRNHLFEMVQEEVEIVSGGKTNSAGTDIKLPIQTVERKNDSVRSYIPSSSESESSNQLQTVSAALRKISKLIEELPGFQKTAKDLMEKAGRLEHKGFTVALFGAFSAGKSSFANALMGEIVLPVSPNPTTAAINKILPVNDQYNHETVLVYFKAPAAMLEDVNHSLKIFGLTAADFIEAFRAIDQAFSSAVEVDDGLKKIHSSFLQAFRKGFDRYGEFLGTVYQTTTSEFSEFVANEEKSCFVESIELYYDCELTRKGITLVDTPGADSINARHTGVAFNYIKNADAILFVTYYNHAFSKADREFLIQLGRVKESFQLDKMFFIINAIDLAENEEEKETVESYVASQLQTYGIKKPHLYPLSSLIALANPIDERSGLPQFKTGFHSFIDHDLTGMTIAAAEVERKRVLNQLDRLILRSKEEEAVKRQRQVDSESEKRQIQAVLSGQSVENLQSQLTHEAEELLYYCKQRVFFRFEEFFKESFNPAVLKKDGRNLKVTLQESLDELLKSIGFDFAQEMRATTVRLDRFAESALKDFQAILVRRLSEINPDLSFPSFEYKEEDQLLFDNAFQDLDKQMFKKALEYFRNTKAFFEKNEKKMMSEEIYARLQQSADEYLQEQLERIRTYYQAVLEREVNRLVADMTGQAEDYYFSLMSTLNGEVLLDVLVRIQREAPIDKF